MPPSAAPRARPWARPTTPPDRRALLPRSPGRAVDANRAEVEQHGVMTRTKRLVPWPARLAVALVAVVLVGALGVRALRHTVPFDGVTTVSAGTNSTCAIDRHG